MQITFSHIGVGDTGYQTWAPIGVQVELDKNGRLQADQNNNSNNLYNRGQLGLVKNDGSPLMQSLSPIGDELVGIGLPKQFVVNF